jgi:hypothetical protein
MPEAGPLHPLCFLWCSVIIPSAEATPSSETVFFLPERKKVAMLSKIPPHSRQE